jgi:hypothetical protein
MLGKILITDICFSMRTVCSNWHTDESRRVGKYIGDNRVDVYNCWFVDVDLTSNCRILWESMWIVCGCG